MVEDWGEAYHPNEEPAVPKFLLSSLYNAMFYSAVVLFLLLKKTLAPREGESWEERVGYSFDEVSASSCMILNCQKKKKKKDPEPHFHCCCCFYPNCFQTWSASTAASSAALTLNYAWA